MKILFFVCALTLAAAPNDSFLLRGITVHPVSRSEIANGSVLVIDGRIAEVGEKIAAPKGIKVIDGKGLHVYPGMIDSATELGLSEISGVRETVDTDEIGEFNPQLRAEVAVNPSSEHIPVTRANGITTVITLPSGAGNSEEGGGRRANASVITGQAALIHLDGWTWEEMEVRKTAAMEMLFPTISSGARPGGGRLPRATFAESKRAYDEKIRGLNEFFEQARRYRHAPLATASGFKPDLKCEAMSPVLDGKVPLMVIAQREREIRGALEFADRQKVKMVLAAPRKLGDLASQLKAKEIPVIVGPTLELPLEEDDPYDSAFTLPGELFKAGVKFAFGSFGNQFSRNLPYQAAAAVAFGLPYDQALRAVTQNAADIWGVGDQLGSIDKGKWADLMVTDGDPLEAKTQIKQLFIKGQQVDLSTRHTRLYEKYLGRP
jgi:imidazolonepropionase-like amidohydrolase